MDLRYNHMTLVCKYAATRSKQCHLRVYPVAKMFAFVNMAKSKAGTGMNHVDLML